MRLARAQRDGTALGVVRVALGLLLLSQALVSARELGTIGYFGDAFHLPFIPEAWVASGKLYAVIIAARLIASVLVVIGHRGRPALFVSGALLLYVLLCDRLQFHHNRYSLALFAMLMSLAPCDRSFSLVSPEGPTSEAARVGPFWSVYLTHIQIAIIYVASGGSKLLDPDWRSGLVLADRFHRFGAMAIERGVPAFVMEFLGRPDVSSGLSKLAITTELLLAVGLFSKRTRAFALWWGVMFHLTIEITAKVEIYTWLMLTMYGTFVTPDVRARRLMYDPTRWKGRMFGKAVKALDWFARFEVKPWEPDDLKKSRSFVVIRRDGTRATGVRAFAMVTRTIPLLFPLWAPLALVASFTKGGETSAGS